VATGIALPAGTTLTQTAAEDLAHQGAVSGVMVVPASEVEPAS